MREDHQRGENYILYTFPEVKIRSKLSPFEPFSKEVEYDGESKSKVTVYGWKLRVFVLKKP